MPAKSPKTTKSTPAKSALTPARGSAKIAAAVTPSPSKIALPADEGSSDDEEEELDEDDEGVDEEGMAKIMKLLGDDPLDEFEQAQLQALTGDEDEDGSDSEDEEEGPDGSDDEEEQGIALDDVEDSVDEDAVPRQKIEIDNKVALERIRETIQLDSSLPWTEHLSVSYPEAIEVDVNDDLKRELAFYKQALHGANAARALAAKASFPFTRPTDYFAEMVKSDSHMERIRQRLLDESAGIKKSDDKRREREGKKFGKQVQIEKIKERERSKKEMEERLKGLKRKRGDVLDKPDGDDGDAFDVAVEDAITDRPSASKRGKADGGNKLPRTARDSKFGFGGAGKRSKSNTKESTDDFDGSAGRGGRGRGGSRGGRGGRGGSGGRGGRGGSSGGGGRESSGGRSERGGRRGGSGASGTKRLGKTRRIAARSA